MAGNGDFISGASMPLAKNATFDIRPGSGMWWTIQNIYYNGPIELYIISGGNQPYKFDEDSSSGAREQRLYRLTHLHYIQVKYVGGGNGLITWDGITGN